MARLRQFLKKGTTTASLKPEQPLPETTPLLSSLVLYHNITDLPLRNYIDGTVNGNLSAIIKSGVCSDENILLNAWEDIKSQYAEAVGNADTKLYLSLYKEVNRLALVIEQIALCVQCMQLVYTDRFAQELRSLLKHRFKFDVTNPEEYDKELQSCISRSKGFKVQMDLKLSQIAGMANKHQKGAIADTAYYQSLLVTISDHVGYQVQDNITVFELANRIKRLNAYIEQMQKK